MVKRIPNPSHKFRALEISPEVSVLRNSAVTYLTTPIPYSHRSNRAATRSVTVTAAVMEAMMRAAWGLSCEGEAFDVDAVDAADDEGGEGYGGEHGEDFHDFGGAVGGAGEVDVEGVVEQVALGFDGVEEAGEVVVEVAEVELVLR